MQVKHYVNVEQILVEYGNNKRQHANVQQVHHGKHQQKLADAQIELDGLQAKIYVNAIHQ